MFLNTKSYHPSFESHTNFIFHVFVLTLYSKKSGLFFRAGIWGGN